MHDERTVWTWSSQTRKVTKATLPADRRRPARERRAAATPPAPLTPQEAADQALRRRSPRPPTSPSGASAKVAGRPAYDLRLVPRERTSLVGSVDLYVDAATGHRAAHGGDPAGQHRAGGGHRVHLPQPGRRRAASTFRFTPPPGSTVRTVPVPADGRPRSSGCARADAADGHHRRRRAGRRSLVTSALPAAARRVAGREDDRRASAGRCSRQPAPCTATSAPASCSAPACSACCRPTTAGCSSAPSPRPS